MSEETFAAAGWLIKELMRVFHGWIIGAHQPDCLGV